MNKHPELVRQYPEMGRLMAHSLLVSGNKVKMNRSGDYEKYIQLSRKCHRDIKLIIKSDPKIPSKLYTYLGGSTHIAHKCLFEMG